MAHALPAACRIGPSSFGRARIKAVEILGSGLAMQHSQPAQHSTRFGKSMM
jgi:hypothetical protein